MNWVVPFVYDLLLDPVFPVGQFMATGWKINFDTLQGRINFVQIFMTGGIGSAINYIIVLIMVSIARNNKRFDTYYMSDNKHDEKIRDLMRVTFFFTTIIWWIVNIVRNTTGLTTDANGIPVD